MSNCCESLKSFIKYCYPLSKSALLGVDWCGEFDCKNDFYISRSNVDFYVLIYTVSGKGVIKTGDKTYYAEKNTLAIIGGEKYCYHTANDEWKFKFIHLKGVASNEIVNAIINKNTIVFPFLDNEYFDKIITLIKNMEDEAVISREAYNLLLSAYYLENSAPQDEIILAIQKYVANNLSGDLSVEKLADVVNLSRPYFSEYFLKKCGKSPSNYVIDERLKRAKYLLYTTNKSINEIACLCGYYDVSSFIRLFKRYEGVSPYKFRKTNPLA